MPGQFITVFGFHLVLVSPYTFGYTKNILDVILYIVVCRNAEK